MEQDRRAVCAVRLNRRRQRCSIVYNDSTESHHDSRRDLFVARLSDGVVVVTQR